MGGSDEDELVVVLHVHVSWRGMVTTLPSASLTFPLTTLGHPRSTRNPHPPSSFLSNNANPPPLQFFFCFAAMVLLIFVSVSSPVWENIYFLTATVTDEIRYGIWGYCITGGECSKATLGYQAGVEVVGGK